MYISPIIYFYPEARRRIGYHPNDIDAKTRGGQNGGMALTSA